MQHFGVGITKLQFCFWLLVVVVELSRVKARHREAALEDQRTGRTGGKELENWLQVNIRTSNQPKPQSTCPTRQCKCKEQAHGLHLKCSPYPEPLEDIPHFKATGVTFQSVALARHNFTTIGNYVFVNIRTLHLDLSWNLLESGVSKYAFKGLEMDLKMLDLSHCNLAEVPSHSIRRLRALTALRLNDNSITHLARNSFRHMGKLEDLALYRNLIGVISPGAFTGLHSLQNLKLFRNDVTVLPRKVFSKLPNLTSLDFSWNQLVQIPSGSLRPLSKLTWLDLGYNHIQHISQRTLKGARRLKFLNLEHNPLQHIDNAGFLPVRRLNYLSLDINMSCLTNQTFSGLSKLEHLYLGDANRSSFPPNVFSSMRKLKFLSLTDYGDKLDGLKAAMFSPELNLEQLKIWLVPMHSCSCTQPWIIRLVRRGVFLHGYCNDGRPIFCNRKRPNVRRSSHSRTSYRKSLANFLQPNFIHREY